MEPGDEIIWTFTPRGGYGYSYNVAGRVIKVTVKRVLIEVPRHDGVLVQRWVRPENVKARAYASDSSLRVTVLAGD